MNSQSLMEKKAEEWAIKAPNGGPRPDKVDYEISKLSQELSDLTNQEKEISKKRIELLTKITTMRANLDNLIRTYKAPEWIEAHPKPKKQTPKMSELSTILKDLTPAEREAFWEAAKSQAEAKKRGGK